MGGISVQTTDCITCSAAFVRDKLAAFFVNTLAISISSYTPSRFLSTGLGPEGRLLASDTGGADYMSSKSKVDFIIIDVYNGTIFLWERSR